MRTGTRGQHPVLRAVAAHRARLLDMERATAHALTGTYTRATHHAGPVLVAAADAYGRELAHVRAPDASGGDDEAGDPSARVPLHWLVTSGQLARVRRAALAAITPWAQDAAHLVTHAQQQAVTAATVDTQATLAASVPPGVVEQLPRDFFQRPRGDAVAALVGRLSNGSPLSDFFASFGPDAADALQRTLYSALAAGTAPGQVASELADTLDMSLSRALTIARTEMLGAYRAATLLNYQANRDVVNGWVWLATDDGRCCAACLSMQGSKHDVDEDMGTHVNCRCAMVPETKSWDDILGPLGIDTSDIPDTTLDVESGADWFARQSAATQRAIIGSQAGYDAYQAGDIALCDFVGVTHSATWGTSRYQKSLTQLGIQPKQKGR